MRNAPAAGPRKKSVFSRIAKDYQLYLLVLPALIWYVLFAYVPMYGVQIAFKDYSGALGILGSPWVGIKHFRSFFRSYYAWTLIKNTVVLSLYSMAAGFPIPIILSLMLNEVKSPGRKKFAQTVLYAPHFISIVVLVGMLNLFFSAKGPMDALRTAMGLESVNYLTSPGAFRHLYVWSGVWQEAGWGCVIYLAALSGVDPGLHEAAMIDGASRFQRIWHINLPCLLPTATILLIMNAGSIMNQGAQKAFLMQTGTTAASQEIIATYVYKVGLIQNQFSYSSAIGLFNNVINIILLVTVNTVSRRLSENSLW